MIVFTVLAIIPSLIAAFPLSTGSVNLSIIRIVDSSPVNDREKARNARVRDPFASAQLGPVQDFKECCLPTA
jgi:hypothetical protein